MKYRFPLLILLLLPLVMSGCSNGNSDAPPANQAHPLAWLSTHPAAALAVADFADCTSCHGSDLAGKGEAVSCYSCHAFNTTPPFIVHPAAWTDIYINHRGYAATYAESTCAACHGATLLGSVAAPSCFSATFDGRSCHPDGPGVAPHPLDSTYLNGALHGPDAKADLTSCQACHADPGGPGSNPRFNIGIASAGDNGCESCHGVNYAHPANWAGPNTTFHYSAGNIQNACSLCHGAALDGVGGVGITCLGCHADALSFTLDCAACHGNPPDGTADLDVPTGVPHGAVAAISLHDVCVACHGMKESTTGGSFSAATNYSLFDKTTDTLGDHWNGSINMNSAPAYNETNFGCDAAGCHGNNPAHQLSDSGLPVALKDFGLGAAVPHPTNGSFLDPANHGPAAKGLTAAFPNGLVDCQGCHASAGGPGSNPRFNIGIGGNGCETCHDDFTAHPTVGAIRDNTHWYDGGASNVHSDVNGFNTMCTLCHGASLEGGVGSACSSCHTVDPVANASGCVSCHNVPPDSGTLAGAVRPNRQGEHDRFGHTSLINADPALTCSRCHDGVGVGMPAHFDQLSPADVVFLNSDPSDTISAISSGTNTTCNGNCHLSTGGNFNHTNFTWY